MNESGIWDQNEANQYHQSSPKLAAWLASYLPKEKNVIDFGCGNAFYCAELAKEGFMCVGVEGYPLNNFLHKEPIIIKDLTKPFDLPVRGSVISLEVGEHLPKEAEQQFLDTITKHCTGNLIISWAEVGQPGIGHINCQPQEYVISEVKRRGFDLLEVLTKTVRQNHIDKNCDWFERTLLIFKAKSSVRSKMKEVTLILTSCNRVDLLRRTMDSFLALNTYPIKRFIGHNDGDDRLFRNIKTRYPQIEWHFSGTRIGYARSLDKLLSMVDTDYVWSTEEDWSYYKNPGFIERSMRILEEHSYINQVWVRDIEDHQHPHGEAMILPVCGSEVRPVIPGYRKIWNGFSLNPGLRRMSDLKKFFPEGLSKCGDGDEATLAQHTATFDYKAVSLVQSSIKHIGWNRRSINFKP